MRILEIYKNIRADVIFWIVFRVVVIWVSDVSLLQNLY
jgi:hypothetical protein